MSTFLIHRSFSAACFAFPSRVKIINYESILFGVEIKQLQKTNMVTSKMECEYRSEKHLFSDREIRKSPKRPSDASFKIKCLRFCSQGKSTSLFHEHQQKDVSEMISTVMYTGKEGFVWVKHSDWALDVVDREPLSCRHPNRTDWRRCHPTANSSYPCRNNPASSMVSSHYCCLSDYLSIEARPPNANESFVCDRRLHHATEWILVDCVERRRSCTLPWRLRRDPWRCSPRNHVDTSISSTGHSHACWLFSDQDWSACFCRNRSSFDTEARRDQLSIRIRTALGRTLWQQVAGRSVVWEPA